MLPVRNYFETLHATHMSAACTDAQAAAMSMQDGMSWAIAKARSTTAAGFKLMFIGNGGSAGIASHMAIDYSKNGGLRSLAFNDGAALTCLGNDLGYENVFAKQIEMHGRGGDMLIAISSSGASPNILKAIAQARQTGCSVLTLSGFKADNPLRQMGDVNLYVPSMEYGFVELSHLTLLHCILDLACGWSPAK
jgi:D-sedoheptulose 7-phosphate isomerase